MMAAWWACIVRVCKWILVSFKSCDIYLPYPDAGAACADEWTASDGYDQSPYPAPAEYEKAPIDGPWGYAPRRHT